MPNQARVSGPFADILRAGRDHFNAQFAEARRAHDGLAPSSFGDFLADSAAPWVNTVAAARPDRTVEAAQVAYATALTLVGKQLAGAGSRFPLIERGWRTMFPAVAPCMAQDPGRLIVALTNALYNLAAEPGVRGEQWVQGMAETGAQCESPGALEALGSVLAWRAGMAHYRDGALAACASLPAAVALQALGAHIAPGAPALESAAAIALQELRADPWLSVADMDPEAIRTLASRKRAIRIVARAGTFRGFGGAFAVPPTVTSDGARLYVKSDQECWALFADACGSVLRRVPAADFERAAAVAATAKKAFSVVGGRASIAGDSAVIDELSQVTSLASTATTLAATTRTSHAILLIARA